MPTLTSMDVPQESNSIEVFCQTEDGTWMPVMIVRVDESLVDKSLYASPLKFQLRFAEYDYSKAMYSDRTLGEPGTCSSEDESYFQHVP